MMRALGRYLLSDHMSAVFITASFTFVGLLFLPLLFVCGGTPLALVTLHHGAIFGLRLIASASLVLFACLLVFNINPIAVVMLSFIWAPVWLLAVTLRYFRSQGITLALAGLLICLWIVGLWLSMEDISVWWHEGIFLWVETFLPEQSQEIDKDSLLPLMPYMSAFAGMSLILSLMLVIFIARWWQACLFNPGGFGKEFCALAIPRGLLYMLVGIYIGYLGSDGNMRIICLNLLLVLGYLFFFQGLAVVHHVCTQKQLSSWYLVAMYILLLVPQMTIALAFIGMLEGIFMLRKRLAGI